MQFAGQIVHKAKWSETVKYEQDDCQYAMQLLSGFSESCGAYRDCEQKQHVVCGELPMRGKCGEESVDEMCAEFLFRISRLKAGCLRQKIACENQERPEQQLPLQDPDAFELAFVIGCLLADILDADEEEQAIADTAKITDERERN